jgi:hypothetical protein
MTLRATIVSAVPLALAAWALACGGQPPPQCTIGRGGHAVRYSLKEGTGPCSTKKGEIVGAQSYRVPNSGQLPTLALQPNALLALQGRDPDTTHLTYSSGSFTSDYPEQNLCVVPSTSEARQSAPASGSTPAQDLRYQWSNVTIYDSTAIPGTQWTADLTYTENGCTATYRAVGVFPAVSCTVTSGGQPVRDASGNLVTNAALCKSRVLGLSIDPHYPIRCDGDTGLCVLDGEPPALTP